MIRNVEEESMNENIFDPSEEDIRIHSYLIWERDGKPDGRDKEYWFRAKEELIAGHAVRRVGKKKDGDAISPQNAPKTATAKNKKASKHGKSKSSRYAQRAAKSGSQGVVIV